MEYGQILRSRNRSESFLDLRRERQGFKGVFMVGWFEFHVQQLEGESTRQL